MSTVTKAIATEGSESAVPGGLLYNFVPLDGVMSDFNAWPQEAPLPQGLLEHLVIAGTGSLYSQKNCKHYNQM